MTGQANRNHTGVENAAAKRTRRTQQERTAATLALVDEAVIKCLVQAGYAATTMVMVTETAGVSQGAITHHHKTKRHMLIAAMRDLASRQEDLIREAAQDLAPGPDRTRSVIAKLWTIFKSDVFYAMLELWNASRTDEELLEALRSAERDQGALHRDLLAEAMGPDVAGHPNFGLALDMTFNLMRGVGLTAILRDNPGRDDQLIGTWTDLFIDLTSTNDSED